MFVQTGVALNSAALVDDGHDLFMCHHIVMLLNTINVCSKPDTKNRVDKSILSTTDSCRVKTLNIWKLLL